MSESLERSLRHPVEDADAAVVELARTYALVIDNNPRRLATLGPALLRALEELQLTPKARAAVKGATVAGTSALDELRARRASRLNNAPDLDATAP